MSKQSLVRQLLRKINKNKGASSWLVSIIIIIVVLIFAPDILNFNHDPAMLDNEEATEVTQQFKGSNFESLPTLTKIPIDFVDLNDGDTITASLNNHEFTIRYLMIDTPEMNYNESGGPEDYAVEAKDMNESMLTGASQLYMELDVGPVTDDYDRVLAYVYADDQLISESIIEEGLGTVRYVNPPNNSYENQLREAEDQARSDSLNLWSALITQMKIM